jgi:hypothetical protein
VRVIVSVGDEKGGEEEPQEKKGPPARASPHIMKFPYSQEGGDAG